jgi:hypothetical protein
MARRLIAEPFDRNQIVHLLPSPKSCDWADQQVRLLSFVLSSAAFELSREKRMKK